MGDRAQLWDGREGSVVGEDKAQQWDGRIGLSSGMGERAQLWDGR